jgi:predicted Zn-dependent peptidase
MNLTTLDNGFRVVFDHLPHVETVTIGVWCGVGARNEPTHLSGISHFIEHCMFKGTTNRTLDQIINDGADIGGRMNAYTDYDTTCYYIECLAEYASHGLDLITDMVMNPIYPQDELDRERGVVIQEIMMYDDQPDYVADEAARSSALPNQALGRPILGSVDIIKSLSRDDLLTYYKSNYGPDKMVLVISGKVPPTCQEILLEYIKSTFGTMTNLSTATTEPFVFSSSEARVEKDVNQVNVVMLFPSCAGNNPDRYATRVLANILGGGLSSRLFREVREKRGLCYGIGAHVEQNPDGGMLCISSGTENGNELIEATCAEIVKITREPVTDDEMKRARASTKMNMVSALEKTMGRASYTAAYLLRYNRLFDIQHEIDQFDKVTIEDVSRVAHTIFTNKPTLGLSGREINDVISYDTIVDSLAV